MGLFLDVELLHAFIGVGGDPVPTIDAGYSFTGWGLLHATLSTAAATYRRISVHAGGTVHGVIDAPGGAIVQSSGGDQTADLVVGADGYNSVVRRAVAPNDPTSTYSVFVLWRGLVDESSLPRGFGRHVGLDIETAPDAVLATFTIPGADGATRPGQRRGVYTWFDASRTGELAAAGRLEQSHVRGTWHGRTVPTDTVAELQERARRWLSPWRDAIADSIGDHRFIGTPVAEYLPTRLAADAVAIVGDAAHVVSPVTGAGFHNAMLEHYGKERLPLAVVLVAESRAWSARRAGGGHVR
jgi:2-polyprenyl-6-methoxyphenol hydroxylase-like FAD-dependent oxidoreductase